MERGRCEDRGTEEGGMWGGGVCSPLVSGERAKSVYDRKLSC